MTLFKICFELWKQLMTYDGKDPEWDLRDYQGIFWDYLNYSYIRKEWSIKSEWKWGDESIGI
jgi:hypothetical protein